MLSYLHAHNISCLTANWAICCSVNCALDYMPRTIPEEVIILSGNQSCWVKAVADRLSDAHLSLVVRVSLGSRLCSVQIFFFFQVICRIARDLWVQKQAWGKCYHFMEMAIPSIHSSGDLSSTLSRSSCHYNPFVKQSFQQRFWIGNASASKTCLRFTSSLLSGKVLKTRNRDARQTSSHMQEGMAEELVILTGSIHFKGGIKSSSQRTAVHHRFKWLWGGLMYILDITHLTLNWQSMFAMLCSSLRLVFFFFFISGASPDVKCLSLTPTWDWLFNWWVYYEVNENLTSRLSLTCLHYI